MSKNNTSHQKTRTHKVCKNDTTLLGPDSLDNSGTGNTNGVDAQHLQKSFEHCGKQEFHATTKDQGKETELLHEFKNYLPPYG